MQRSEKFGRLQAAKSDTLHLVNNRIQVGSDRRLRPYRPPPDPYEPSSEELPEQQQRQHR